MSSSSEASGTLINGSDRPHIPSHTGTERPRIARWHGASRSPATGSAKRGLSSAGRAPDLHSGGHRFDPGRLHHRCTVPAQRASGAPVEPPMRGDARSASEGPGRGKTCQAAMLRGRQRGPRSPNWRCATLAAFAARHFAICVLPLEGHVSTCGRKQLVGR